jgi:hypothetical protein
MLTYAAVISLPCPECGVVAFIERDVWSVSRGPGVRGSENAALMQRRDVNIYAFQSPTLVVMFFENGNAQDAGHFRLLDQ